MPISRLAAGVTTVVLSDRDIAWVLETGDLQITPDLATDRIQGACIDLLLDEVIQVPQNGSDFTVELDTFNATRFVEQHSKRKLMQGSSGHVLKPGDFIIGKTVETVGLSPRLAGRVEGRSRYARVGIGVHVTAPKIDPGFEGSITLEIFNLGLYSCRLIPGMTIATLQLEWLSSPADRAYQGQFQHQ